MFLPNFPSANSPTRAFFVSILTAQGTEDAQGTRDTQNLQKLWDSFKSFWWSPAVLVVASQVVLTGWIWARGPQKEHTQSIKGTDSSPEKVNSALSDVTRESLNKPERTAQSLKEAEPKPKDTSPGEGSSSCINSIPLECLRVTYKWPPLAE